METFIVEQNRNCCRNGQNRCYYNQGTSVKYTASSGSKPRSCDSGTATSVRTDRPLGMAYIPEQLFENLYDAKCGLMEGTMFKDLNLVFCGVRGK